MDKNWMLYEIPPQRNVKTYLCGFKLVKVLRMPVLKELAVDKKNTIKLDIIWAGQV